MIIIMPPVLERLDEVPRRGGNPACACNLFNLHNLKNPKNPENL